VPKQIIKRREIPLPALPMGSESSLRVVDLVHDNGSVKRIWTKDDGVQVLGLTAENKVIAITEKGYTHLIGGYIEPGEKPEQAARRELLEETGYNACTLKLLSCAYHDSGGSNRALWLYLATGCCKTGNGEKDIDVILMEPNEFWKFIITHIKTESDTIPKKGLMSMVTATLAFQELGWLTYK